MADTDMNTRHTYNSIEIMEDDLRAEQPEKIKTELKPHQLASLYKAQLLESTGSLQYNVPNPELYMRPVRGKNALYRDNFVVQTNMGLIGDIVGYGKTLTALALVASVPISNIHQQTQKTYAYYGYKSRAYMQVNCQMPEDKDERKLFGTTLIIVPRGPVYAQWEHCIQEKTNLKYLAIDDLRVIKKKCLPTGATNEQLKEFFENYDVVLVKNTSIGKLIEHYDVPFRTNPIRGFKRIMIDEAHDILSRVPLLDYSFLWMITASYAMMHTTAVSNYYMAGVVRDLLNEERLNTILIKCENNFTKKSFEIPAYREIIYKCFMPRIVSILQPFLNKNVLDLVNANDIEGAIRELGGNAQTKDNILTVFTKNIRRDIHNKEREREYVMTLDLKEDARAARLKHIDNDLEKLKKQLEDLEERIKNMSTDLCPICYDDIQGPIILTCSHVFCGKCIMEWIKINETEGNRTYGIQRVCPKCRAPISKKEDLTAIIQKPNNTADASTSSNSVSKALSKLETIIQIIEKKPNGKFLIFSQYDSTFFEVIKKLHELDITISELKGNSHQMANILERFKTGDLKVILLNTYYAGSGIDISCATDVILFHSMGMYSEQAIGRAQRVGRTEQLTVHKLCYPNEL